MSARWYKKPVIACSAILLIIVISVASFFLKRNHPEADGPVSAENSRISVALKRIDSTYWENPRESVSVINGLISASEKANDNSALALCLYYKSACYVIMERYDSAFILCHTALRFAEEKRNELVAGKMKVVLANYFMARNEFNEANKCLMDALQIFEEQGTPKDMANVLNGFGLLYYNLKQPDKAIGYYSRVMALSKDEDKKRQESVACLNISNCYRNKQDLKMTQYYLDKALNGFTALKDSAFIMMCNMNRGIVLIDQGKKEEGLSYYFLVMDYSKRMDKKVLLGHTLFNIANVYYQDNDPVQAGKYFLESMDVYRSILNKDGEKNVLLQLSVMEQDRNNWKQAFEYYNRYIGIRDSILNAGLLKDINDLQWKYDFQKKEDETKKRIEVKQRETVIIVISFTFVIVVVLMFVALVRLANKNLRKSDNLKKLQILYLQEQMEADSRINELEKLKLKAEIESKNKELTSSSMQLISKNEILESISDITENFFRKNALNDECYMKLKSVYKENLDQERDWEHFKRLFEEVHTDFFKNIKTVCPEITENELRLCAYLKINLQNKEIAKILNVTPESLKTLRYRIRKKLNLPKEAILEEYIRGI